MATTVADNSMIKIESMPDNRVMIVLKREAQTEEDVTLCITAFETLFTFAAQNSRKYRLRVKTQSVNLSLREIKMSIIQSISTHFEKNAMRYLVHVEKCCIEVANTTLAKLIQGIVTLVSKDTTKIFVTSSEKEAIAFLSQKSSIIK